MQQPDTILDGSQCIRAIKSKPRPGLVKGAYGGDCFADMMASIEPFLLLFAVSGLGLMLGHWRGRR